jgi:DNA repair exonuclease SbcCD ATPase subunit
MSATNRDYTLKQIARDLDLPEATVRYYRDSLDQFIPSHGTGRTRRYPQEALDLLREASEMVRDEGLSLEQVTQRWRNEKAIDATTTTTTQQQDNNNGKALVPVSLNDIVNFVGATWGQLAQQEGNATRQAITQGFQTLAEAFYNAEETRKTLQSVQLDLAQTRGEVERLTQERNNLRKSATEAQDAVTRAGRERDQALGRLEEAEAQVARLVSERDIALRRVEALQGEIQTLKEALEKQQRDNDRPLTWRERMTGRRGGANAEG